MTVPRLETTCAALRLACRAPSVHNSQPWRWVLGEQSVRLCVDRSRMLPVLDPTGRELVISCGAALHHARVAFAAACWPVTVHELPQPSRPEHLATLSFGESTVDDPGVDTTALAQRHSDRRPFRPDPVSDRVLTSLVDAAGKQGASLVVAPDGKSRDALVGAIRHAASVHRELPEYWREFAQWTGVHCAARDTDEAPSDDFALVTSGELPTPVLDDGAVLGVLATKGDSYESWLHAGEALSAVLLEATRHGLATCTLSQVAELADSRLSVRRDVLGDAGQPQLAVRIGWPVTREHPGPRSPRRPVSESIEQLRSV